MSNSSTRAAAWKDFKPREMTAMPTAADAMPIPIIAPRKAFDCCVNVFMDWVACCIPFVNCAVSAVSRARTSMVGVSAIIASLSLYALPSLAL